MLFFFTSTRTRISFEAGMAQLGGHAQFIDHTTTQISHGDTAKEIGEILGRYTDGIAIRQCDWGIGNAYINAVADASRVPVLNMQCEIYHPFQILADLMTIQEKVRERPARQDHQYQLGLCLELSKADLGAAELGAADVALRHESAADAAARVSAHARYRRASAGEHAASRADHFEIIDDFDAGFAGADILYPKSWGSWLTTEDEAESAEIGAKYTDWIADDRRMSLADDNAVYMHCLPADRNIEVTDSVIDGPQSVVYDEAENRLHVQKAAMALTMR